MEKCLKKMNPHQLNDFSQVNFIIQQGKQAAAEFVHVVKKEYIVVGNIFRTKVNAKNRQPSLYAVFLSAISHICD